VVRITVNELRTFGESWIFADFVQIDKVAFARGAVKQLSVTQDAISAVLRLLLLLIPYTHKSYHYSISNHRLTIVAKR